MRSKEFWISQFSDHLTKVNPDLYQDYLDSGELDAWCDSVAREAQATFEQLAEHYQTTGSNRNTAEMLAESEVMRSHILSIGVKSEAMDEEPDEDMDEDYLSFLREE